MTVQLAPSAITTRLGSDPARRRARITRSPSLICRQPRVLTSSPARATCGTAPSITESPMASGGAKRRPSFFGGYAVRTPPHAAPASTEGASRVSANTSPRTRAAT